MLNSKQKTVGDPATEIHCRGMGGRKKRGQLEGGWLFSFNPPSPSFLQTLKRPWSSPRGDVSAVHSGSNPAAVEGNPLLVISTAQAPLTEKLGPLSMGDVSRGMLTTYPAAAQWNLMDFVDPLLVGEGDSTHDLFKASHWSPAGYSHLGG